MTVTGQGGLWKVETAELHRRAVESFDQRVEAIRDDQWSGSTPCSDWDVRTLVNHLVNENLWTVPLMQGKTIAEVGDAFDGDLLGDDPNGAWKSSSVAAVGAVSEPGALERTIHLSFGDTPAEEYAFQLLADHLIHSWDLARAIGDDESLDPEVVSATKKWFEQREDLYRGGGAIAERPEIPPGADDQTVLLAMFGRRA